MADDLQFINFDTSYPAADNFHTANTTGVIRFTTGSDSVTLSMFQRVQGDIAHRFHLVEQHYNTLIGVLRGNPYLQTFDDGRYMWLDGTRAFTGPVAGRDPTIPAHLATKAYVDARDQVTTAEVAELQTGLTEYFQATVRPFFSAWTEHQWRAGQRDHLELPLVVPPGVSVNYAGLASVAILERLDISQPTVDNPSPSPAYRYATLAPGQATGFRVDAVWLDTDTGTVHVLIPNSAAYPPYPGVVDWGGIVSPRSRHLRAVVQAPVV